MLLLLAASASADVALCVPGAVSYVWPEAQSVDVPTNAAPFALALACPAEGADVTGSLEDAAGAEVASAEARVEPGGWSELLTFAPGPLTAGEPYVTTVSSPANEVQAGFTVGSAEATPITEAPTLTLSEVVVEGEGGGGASGAVSVPDGALVLAVFGNTGERETLVPIDGASSVAFDLRVNVAPDEAFCASASVLDATGTWTDSEEVCTTAKSGYTSICGVTGASSVSMLGLGLGALFVGRRRGR